MPTVFVRFLEYPFNRPVAFRPGSALPTEPDIIVYELTRPTPDGRTSIQMSAFDLLDRLAELIVPPRTRRHSYQGVLAPHSRLRQKVIESAAPAAVVAMQIAEAAKKMGNGSFDSSSVPVRVSGPF